MEQSCKARLLLLFYRGRKFVKKTFLLHNVETFPLSLSLSLSKPNKPFLHPSIVAQLLQSPFGKAQVQVEAITRPQWRVVGRDDRPIFVVVVVVSFLIIVLHCHFSAVSWLLLWNFVRWAEQQQTLSSFHTHPRLALPAACAPSYSVLIFSSLPLQAAPFQLLNPLIPFESRDHNGVRHHLVFCQCPSLPPFSSPHSQPACQPACQPYAKFAAVRVGEH